MGSSTEENASAGSLDVPSVLKSLPPTAERLAQTLPEGDQQALAHLVVTARSMTMEQTVWDSHLASGKNQRHLTGLVAVASKYGQRRSTAFINTRSMPERCSASPHSRDIDSVLELVDESSTSPPAEVNRVDSKPELKQGLKGKGKGKRRTPEKIEEEKETTHLGRTQGKLPLQNHGKEEARKRGKGKSSVACAMMVEKPSLEDVEKGKDPTGEGYAMNESAEGNKVLPGSYALEGEGGELSIAADEEAINDTGLTDNDSGGYRCAISQGGKHASKRARRRSKKVVPLNAIECTSSSRLLSSTTENNSAVSEASSRGVVGRIDQHVCGGRNVKERGVLSRLCPHAFVGFADRLIDLLSGRM